jgi:large subunit ribosomal protein L20
VAGIELDRKVLAELAIHDAAGFTALTDKAKSVLTKKTAA